MNVLDRRIEEASDRISRGLTELGRTNWTGAETLRDAGAQGLLETIEHSLMERYGSDEGERVFSAALDQVAAEIGA